MMVPFIWIALYAKKNLMAFSDEEAPYYIWNRDFCSTTQEKEYDVVILGDSVSNAAYMPEILSDSTVNLALGGTTPMENYYTMKEYLENNTAPQTVYISFMDSHLQRAECYWKRSMYSHRYSARDSWEMLQSAKKYYEENIYTESSYLDWIAYELYLPSKYITSLTNASFNTRLEGNINAYESDGLRKGRYIAVGNNEGSVVKTYDSFYVASLFDNYYNRLIALCLENDITVRIIKLPLLNSDTFTEGYIEQFNVYYEDLKEKYPGITVDWWNVGYDSNCFCDSHHMNTHGAFKFSVELKEKYSQDFTEGYSEDQITAINSDIAGENYLSELFKWVDVCPNYSLVIYDGLGDFEYRYESDFKQSNLTITENKFWDESSGVYVIENCNRINEFDQIFAGEGLISIEPGDGTSYNWEPYNFKGISTIVVDNTYGTIVCDKKFQYIENSYFAIQ